MHFSRCLLAFALIVMLTGSTLSISQVKGSSGQDTFLIHPSISVKSDPAGHAQYIGLHVDQLTILVSGGEIMLSGTLPWVNLSGSMSGDNSFSASGQGIVAGYPNVGVTMSGTFQNGNLDGTLTMGGNGELPTGKSISYSISGSAQTQPQTPVTTPPPSTATQTPTTPSSVTTQNQENTNSKIPKWVRNNALWWASGEIQDSDMLKGLQYLITEQVIVIPATKQGQGTSQIIPGWIKNDAMFWSHGGVSDSEFIGAIQYLVENGIITIGADHSGQPMFNIDKKTVQVSVEGKSYVTVSGKISNYQRGDPVIISITRPDHSTDQLSIYAKSTGEFTTPLEFDQNSMHGTYNVSIIYGTQNLGTSTFSIGEPGYTTPLVESMPNAIGCAGGVEAGDSHDFAWWNGQKNRYSITEGNLTILKQPTNTACGPTVGAIDLLHWNATIAPGIVMGKPEDLIKRLMHNMHYRDGWGTTNMTIAAGLSDYINMTGYGGKLRVSVYGSEYTNGTANTNTGTVYLVHSDTINSTLLHNAMAQKSNVLVIINSPDGMRSHIMKLLAINDTADSEGRHAISFIDTFTGGIIVEGIDDSGNVTYEGRDWALVNIITVTPTGSK